MRVRVRLAGILPVVLLALGAPVVQPDARPTRVRTWSLEIRSSQAEAPDRFGLVGVTWPASAKPPAGVEVRTSLDGRSWGPWTALQLLDDDGPDAGVEGNGRTGTTPLWVGAARYTQVRFEGGRPAGARVNAVDPGPDPARRLLPSAGASPSQPRIFTRAEWGADESMRRAGPRYAPGLSVAFVHHTATGNDYGPGDSARIVRSIYAYHVQSNGWDDIGYNFLVDRYGQVFEGRYGGMDRPVIGAHAQGFNTGSAGVSVIGTFNDGQPPSDAYTALHRLLAWKLDLHYIDPMSDTTMVSGGSPKYTSGTTVRLARISGHRDTGNTDCPGQKLYESLGYIRQQTAAIGDPKLYDLDVAVQQFTPNGDGVDEEAVVRARFSSGVAWTVDVKDMSGGLVRRFTGNGTYASVHWNGTNAAGARQPVGQYDYVFNATNASGSIRPVEVPVFLRTTIRPIVGIDASAPGVGYWQASDDGAIRAFGAAQFYGSMEGRPLVRPVVGLSALPTGRGYWMVASDGGIFSFGDAQFYGSMGGRPLVEPMVAMTVGGTGGGYWTLASDGGVFTFGNLQFYGSMGGRPLVKPMVGISSPKAASGYWTVASDGGVFTFGNLRFYGSMGGQPLVSPVVAMAATPTGSGYWLVAGDGGIFAFGDAPFYGSMGGRTLSAPIVGMSVSTTGQGYWLVGQDGSTYGFGDARTF